MAIIGRPMSACNRRYEAPWLLSKYTRGAIRCRWHTPRNCHISGLIDKHFNNSDGRGFYAVLVSALRAQR